MASSCEAKRASVLVVHVKDDTKALAAADLIRSTIDGQKDYTGVMPVVMVKGDLNGLSSIDMLRRHGKHPGVIKVVDRRPYSAKDTDDSQCGDSKDPNTCWTDRFLSVSRVDKDIASMSMAHIDISKSDSPPYPSMAARWHVVDPTYSEEGKTKGKAIKVTLLEKKLLKAGFHYVGVVLKKDLWARRGDLISKAGEGISISSSGSGKSEPSHTKGEFLVDILEADSEPADEPKKLQLKFGDGAPISTLYMDYDASKITLTTTTNRAWSSACNTELPSLTDFPNAHKSVYYSLAPGRRLINLKIAPGKWIPADGDVFNDASGQLPGKTGLRKSKVTNPEGDCFKGTLYIEKTCATRRRLDMGDLCDVPASVDDDSGAPVPTGGAVHSGKSQ